MNNKYSNRKIYFLIFKKFKAIIILKAINLIINNNCNKIAKINKIFCKWIKIFYKWIKIFSYKINNNNNITKISK